MADCLPPTGPRSNDPHGETSHHLRRAASGDLAALDALIQRVTPLLLSLAKYRLRHLRQPGCEPMDLVQDVWLRSIPNLARLQPRDGRLTPVLLAWLGTTMRRRARDLLEMSLRHEQAMPLADLGDALPHVPEATRGVVTRVLQNENDGLVAAAIESLPDTDREILLLRGIEQASIAEVATLLGITEGAVKMRFRRALDQLRDQLPPSILDEIE